VNEAIERVAFDNEAARPDFATMNPQRKSRKLKFSPRTHASGRLLAQRWTAH
jgi:hypothetical protein